MLHRDGLADVERRNRVRHPTAELEVLLLVLGRLALRQHAGTRQQRLDERRRVHQLDAVVVEHAGDRANEAVGVLRRELPQHAEKGEIGNDAAGEDLGVLHLAGHDRVADAGVFQHADAPAKLAEGNPVDGRAVATG